MIIWPIFRDCYEGSGIQEDSSFYPVGRAYAEALDVERAERDFALVDLGAMGVNVVLFRDGMLEYEAHLPIGVRTIDTDTMAAFALSFGQARKLKHEYGQALRSICKNKKLPIPGYPLNVGKPGFGYGYTKSVRRIAGGCDFPVAAMGIR